MTHLTFEQISELVESRELKAESLEARHLSECADCRETLRKVRELVSSAHALPRDLAPPPEVWTALRDRVAREPGFRRATTRWWHNGWLATAAAIVLVVGTAILTPNLATRGKASKLKPTQNPSVAMQPVVLLAVDRNYVSTVAELRATLDAQRPALSPSTVRAVERSLAVIDSAIAEAREALASDPANQALVDILSAHYERKVDLLQRASELSSSL
jgi:hypothetical protein